jgi:hypothetical protein
MKDLHLLGCIWSALRARGAASISDAPPHPTPQVGSLVDAVDNMRYTRRELIATHFELSEASRSTGRTELLPIIWHHDFASGDRADDLARCDRTASAHVSHHPTPGPHI